MDWYVSRGKCEECGYRADWDEFLDENEHGEDTPICLVCGSDRVEPTEHRLARWVGVATYVVGRSYGGPEEGGWWYDAGVRIDATIRCFENCDMPQAMEWLENQRRRADEDNADQRHSELRYEVRVFVEEVPPPHFPKHRPYYS